MWLNGGARGEFAQGGAVPPRGEEGLPHRFLIALAWTGAAKWGTQVLSWATTIVVARLLTPSDYGLVGMATLVMGVVTLIAEMGVGTAVVTQRVQQRAALRQLNAVALLVGLGTFALVVAGAPFVARFFRQEELVPLMLGLGVTFVVQSAKTVPEGLLLQEREFRLLAAVEAARSLSGALVTVACALLAYGHWSLVAGYFASALIGTIAILALRPLGFETPKADTVGSVVRVSLDIMGTRLAWYGYSNADFLIAAWVLGPAALGIYTIAWTIATLPAEKIATILNSVSQPFFVANRTNLGALRTQFLKLTEGIALATTPACLGIALVADDLVGALLGEKWSAAALPLRILCLYSPLRCIAVVVPPLLLALGESRYVLLCTLGAAIGLPFCFLLGSNFGLVGIAIAWAVAYPFVAFPLYARSFSHVRVTLAQFLHALRAVVASTLAMTLGVIFLRWMLPTEWQHWKRLALQAGFGVVFWTAALLVLGGPTVRQLLRLPELLRKAQTSPSS